MDNPENGIRPIDAVRKNLSDKLEFRLLTLDDKPRSELMLSQIKAFEDKVYQSADNFDIDIFYKMIGDFSRITDTKIDSILTLRKTYSEARMNREKPRAAKKEKTYRKPISAENAEKVFQFVNWFLKFVDYLKELERNFHDRVFVPLYKYFYDGSLGGQTGNHISEQDTSGSKWSAVSTISSGTVEGSGLLRILPERLTTDLLSYGDEIEEVRKQYVANSAILLLSFEFKDIKRLYDNREVENMAQRLSLLKEQIEYLLEETHNTNPDVFSQDSVKSILNLKIPSGTEDFYRLVPDILIKFKKSAWLAKRWLELDDTKTKDLKRKVEEINGLEEKLSRRLAVLDKNIRAHEHQLDNDTQQLQNMVKREDRVTTLRVQLSQVNQRIDEQTSLLNSLKRKRTDLANLMSRDNSDVETLKRNKTLYENNRRERQAVERELETLNYQKDIIDDDIAVELHVKPSLVRHTNTMQDDCEQLEHTLHNEVKEKHIIEAALVPIRRDRGDITSRLSQSHTSRERSVRNTPVFHRVSSRDTPQHEREQVYQHAGLQRRNSSRRSQRYINTTSLVQNKAPTSGTRERRSPSNGMRYDASSPLDRVQHSPKDGALSRRNSQRRSMRDGKIYASYPVSDFETDEIFRQNVTPGHPPIQHQSSQFHRKTSPVYYEV